MKSLRLTILLVLAVTIVAAPALAQTTTGSGSDADAASDAATPTEPPSSTPPIPPPRDSARERASIHLELATAHFEAGRYDRALLELQTVRELTGRDDLLYNMARCYEGMERAEPAIQNYQRYLETAPEGEVRQDAERRLEALRRAVEAARVAAEEQEAEEEADGPGVGTLIGLGLGGVGLLTGAVFGILTLAEDASLESGCGATHTCTGEDLGSIRVYRSVADLAFVLGAIGGIAGLIGLFLFLGEGDDEDVDSEGDVNALIVPYVVPGEGAGASATLRF